MNHSYQHHQLTLILDSLYMIFAPISDKFDTDKSGKINAKEFSHLCFNLGYALTDVELDLALKVLDDDNSGEIELNEFTNWWKRGDRWASIQLQDEELEKRKLAADTFNSFDSGKTGYITKSDFDAFYDELVKAGLTKQEKSKVFENLDRSGDGRVQFSEYINWLKDIGTFAVALPQKQ